MNDGVYQVWDPVNQGFKTFTIRNGKLVSYDYPSHPELIHELTPDCCDSKAVWINNGPRLQYWYCKKCKNEVK